MSLPQSDRFIIGADDRVLVTGATGFIGSSLVQNLLNRGFRKVRCFVRPSPKVAALRALGADRSDGARPEIFQGNLLSRADCASATEDVAVILHLAAGRGEKSVPDAYINSVVTTRNLLEEAAHHRSLRRFVGVSSFAVYSNLQKPTRRLLDESCPVEQHPAGRRDAYSFAKIKQDEILEEYGTKLGIPHVIVRPGYVYGPGNLGITGRVGTGAFGTFLHLGGSNQLPLTYVENCADAIALAGLVKGVDGEVFNVVDDGLPTSRQFLRMYKRQVKPFRSIYIPHALSYALCYLWERYSARSERQLEPVFNRREWHAYWKKTYYSNRKLKARLGWEPRVSTDEGLRRYFAACRERESHGQQQKVALSLGAQVDADRLA